MPAVLSWKNCGLFAALINALNAKEILGRNPSLFAQIGSDFADAKFKSARKPPLLDRISHIFAVASGPIMEELRPLVHFKHAPKRCPWQQFSALYASRKALKDCTFGTSPPQGLDVVGPQRLARQPREKLLSEHGAK